MSWSINDSSVGSVIQISFNNSLDNTMFPKLHLYKEGTSDWIITATVISTAYEAVCAQLLTVGIMQHRGDNPDVTLCILQTNSKEAIINFIKTIKNNIPNFYVIEGNICSLLEINLELECTTPDWFIGRFYTELGREPSIQYNTGNQRSNVYAISISQYLAGWVISVYTHDNLRFEREMSVIASLQYSNLPGQPFNLFYPSASILDHLLIVIKRFSPNFYSIEQEVRATLGIDSTIPSQAPDLDLSNRFSLANEIHSPLAIDSDSLIPSRSMLTRESSFSYSFFVSLDEDYQQGISFTPQHSSLEEMRSPSSPTLDELHKDIEKPAGLNATQKNIIEGVLSFVFESIRMLSRAYDKIWIFNIILEPNISAQNRDFLNRFNLNEEIDEVRTILAHPYPQNRAVDYPYFGRANTPEGHVVFKDAEGRAAHEPKGLLGLTAWNDNNLSAPRKQHVNEYITLLIKNNIKELELELDVEKTNEWLSEDSTRTLELISLGLSY